MGKKLGDEESGEASKKELKAFVRFCKQKFGYIPTIIGGWAVYSYTGKEHSIDIDVVFSSKKESQKIMGKFFKEKHYKTEEFHDQQKHFVKQVKAGKKTIELRFDYYSYEDENKLVENSDISIPFRLIKNNYEYKKVDSTKIRVPSIELLLLFKVKALRDRDTVLNLKGIKIEKGHQLWLKSKMLKDKRDIKGLIGTGEIDNKKLDKLLKHTFFEKYFDFTMKEIDAL
ncbi:hypothetical protein HY484_03585 [Candidatus Woesearchaeota archaeon]|nr:hypothetical protein [Candidatus Woesearchaeota archaeon]